MVITAWASWVSVVSVVSCVFSTGVFPPGVAKASGQLAPCHLDKFLELVPCGDP